MNADNPKEQERLKLQYPNDKDILFCKKGNRSCYVKGRIQPTYAFGDLHLKYPEFNNPKNYPRSAGYR